MNDEPASERDLKVKAFNYRAAILIFLAVAAAVVFFALQQKKWSQRIAGPAVLTVGQPAPDFTLPGLDGNPVSLSDYRGKVVLVNIWATWCAPCIAEMPSMQKLYRKLQGDNFEILAVSIDTTGSSVVAPFMKKLNLTFPALIDTQGITKTAYGATGVPESFIIDKQGIVVKKIIGPLDWSSSEVLRYFQELLKQ
jgi:peroxiredoxin